MRTNSTEVTRKLLDKLNERLMKTGNIEEARTIAEIRYKLYPRPQDIEEENTQEKTQ